MAIDLSHQASQGFFELGGRSNCVALGVNVKNVADLFHETAADHALGAKQNLLALRVSGYRHVRRGTGQKQRTALQQIDVDTLILRPQRR